MNVSGLDEVFPKEKDWNFYFGVAITSFSLCLFLFHFVSPRFSCIVSSSYHQLSLAKRLDWDTRIGSNLHAVIASAIGLYCFTFDTEARDNAKLSRIGNSITMGYISADFVIILLSYKHIGDVVTVTHHLMAVWAYYFVVVYGVLPYFANFRQLAEISTPFVNQRWFFDMIGQPRTSKGWIINGYMLGVSFFLCRIAIMPMYYYNCYSFWGSQQQRALGGIISFYWISTSVVLDVINLYWFSKIVRGALKLTRKLRDRKEG